MCILVLGVAGMERGQHYEEGPQGTVLVLLPAGLDSRVLWLQCPDGGTGLQVVTAWRKGDVTHSGRSREPEQSLV